MAEYVVLSTSTIHSDNTFLQFRDFPDTPQTLCFCGHPYFAHLSIKNTDDVHGNIPDAPPAARGAHAPPVVTSPPSLPPTNLWAAPSSSLPPSNSRATNPFSTHLPSQSATTPFPSQPASQPSSFVPPPRNGSTNPFAPTSSFPPPRVAFNNVIANQQPSSQIPRWHPPGSVERSSDATESAQHQRRQSIQRMHSTNGTSPRNSRRHITGPSNPPAASSFLEADNGSDGILKLKVNEVAWFFALLPFQVSFGHILVRSLQSLSISAWFSFPSDQWHDQMLLFSYQ
jgi:hypothetical protein